MTDDFAQMALNVNDSQGNRKKKTIIQTYYHFHTPYL